MQLALACIAQELEDVPVLLLERRVHGQDAGYESAPPLAVRTVRTFGST